MLTPNFSPFPPLTTQRLLLRELLPSDAPAVQHLRGNKDVMTYINRPLTLTLQDAEAWVNLVRDNVANNDGITWCICLKEAPSEHVGNIAIWRIEKENYRGEVGYMIEPAHQGKGLMYEALQAVIHYGFATLQLHSLEGRIDPRNKASAAVLSKSGFVQEAYFKENYALRDGFADTAVYSLLTPYEKDKRSKQTNVQQEPAV